MMLRIMLRVSRNRTPQSSGSGADPAYPAARSGRASQQREQRLPHRGGPLADGLTGGSTLVCPLHAWKFDLVTGQALNGVCALRTFAAKVDARGLIVLTVPGQT
jgi:nitrite reductase (NADH) small subunit